LYNILIEFGKRMKLGMLIKICLNETYNKIRGSGAHQASYPLGTGGSFSGGKAAKVIGE
jgi:hypothetical protein